MNSNFRENADPGIWCAFLIPFAVSVTSLKLTSQQSDTDLSTIILSLCLAAYSVVEANRQNVQSKKAKTQSLTSNFTFIGVGCVIAAAIVQSFYQTLDKTIVNSFCLFIFVHYLPKLFDSFPKSFTFGEGCLVLQSLVVFLSKSTNILTAEAGVPTSGYLLIAQSGLLSLIALCSVPVLTGLDWNPAAFYITGSFVIGFVTLPFLWLKLNANPVLWLVESIFDSSNRLKLVSIWSGCIIVAIVVVLVQVVRGQQATTSVRKYFHFLIVAVFTTGVAIDRELLFLSSVVILCVQLLLEYVRANRIGPLSSILNDAFKVFLDEKDAGNLVLTNIYLLAGASAPMWLTPFENLNKVNPVILLSGVTSIGIGDSAASIIGSRFGRFKFPGSPKTVEGTLASILSQIVFVQLFSTLSLELVSAVCLVSVVEALTSQVDNIVLPLLLFTLLTVTV